MKYYIAKTPYDKRTRLADNLSLKDALSVLNVFNEYNIYDSYGRLIHVSLVCDDNREDDLK